VPCPIDGKRRICAFTDLGQESLVTWIVAIGFASFPKDTDGASSDSLTPSQDDLEMR